MASQGQKLFIYKNDQKLLEVNLGFHIVNLFIYQKEQTQTVVTQLNQAEEIVDPTKELLDQKDEPAEEEREETEEPEHNIDYEQLFTAEEQHNTYWVVECCGSNSVV